MASNKRKFRQKPDYDPFEDLDGFDDDNIDLADIALDFYSTDWDGTRSQDRISARRQIDRQRDLKRLNFELDDWDQYLDSAES